MKAILLILIITWVTGVAIGVAHLPIFISVLGAVVGCLFTWMHRKSIQFSTVVLLAIGLGITHGFVATEKQSYCDIKQGEVIGEITQTTIKENGTQYVVRVDDACSVLVYASRFPEYLQGAVVKINGGTWQSINELPAEMEGYVEYLRRKGITTILKYGTVRKEGGSAHKLSSMHVYLRNRIEKIFNEPEASLVLATLLADQGTIPASIVENFRASGVTHILAISGSNISILAAVLFAVLLIFPWPLWVQTSVAIVILWLYLFLIGAPASALRAIVFWTLAVISLRLHRLFNLLSVLLLSTSVLIAIDPLLFLDVGWQLSVAAVIGIFWIMWILQPYLQNQKNKFWHVIILALLTTIGATLWTSPIIIYNFQNLSLVSLPANILIVPASGFLMLLSLAAVILSQFTTVGAILVSLGVHAITNWLIVVTDLLARVPHATIDLSISKRVVFLCYVCLVGVTIIVVQYQRRSWRELWQ